MLLLNYINFALSFYKLSAIKIPLVSLILSVMCKTKQIPYNNQRLTFSSTVKPTGSSFDGRFVFTMKLKPLFNRVTILPEEIKQTSAGGIIIPETTNSLSIGVIEAVSDGLTINPGEKVLYNRNAAIKHYLNGTVIDILDVVDVFAIVCDE